VRGGGDGLGDLGDLCIGWQWRWRWQWRYNVIVTAAAVAITTANANANANADANADEIAAPANNTAAVGFGKGDLGSGRVAVAGEVDKIPY